MRLFYGGFMSNWYPAPFVVSGVEYSCSEQYFMARKAMAFSDDAALEAIMATTNPAKQKAIGRSVKGFDERLWRCLSYGAMKNACREKFTQNPYLRRLLSDTGREILVEASPTDVVWGIGLDERDLRAHCPWMWRGTNWLGLVLMEVRLELCQRV